MKLVNTGFALLIGFMIGCGASPETQEDINVTPDINDVTVQDVAQDNNEPADQGRDTNDTVEGVDALLDQGSGDVGDPCAQYPLGFGCICQASGDCASGYCIEMLEETWSRCTKTCYDACPDGWQCQNVQIAGSDSTYLCMPVVDPLCEWKCERDADCKTAGALCVKNGDQQYCARACDTVDDCAPKTRIKDCDEFGECSFSSGTTEEDCLEDDLTCEVINLEFECVEATNLDGSKTSKQCVPTSGHCECASGTDYDNDVNHCGNCETRCWFANASAYCQQGECKLGGCLSGFVNLNGLDVDGCEYECTFQSPVDHPDDQFIDANCDGIDGDMATGVFVKKGGDDDNFLGDAAHPFATIGAAILFAAQKDPIPEIYVSKGTYQEQVNLKNGVSVYGGYDAENGWKRSFNSNEVILSWNGQESLAVRTVVAKDITEPTVFDGFRIKTSSAAQPSGSSYGMHVVGCDGDLVISNNYIEAGNGMDGRNGSFGTNGQAGSIGTNGSAAFVYDGCAVCVCTEFDFDTNMKPGPGGTSPCGMTGGAGGAGGKLGDGGINGSAAPNGGGLGGAGAPDEEEHGSAGKPGADGGNGSDGSGGLSIGEINASGFFVPLTGGDGINGANGKGGGGGGGGGGDDDAALFGFECYSAGGAGAGGGGGGCGGTAGSGGQGGGGSFGLFLVQSSPQVINNTIKSYFGGNGGIGGAAGTGGTGAAGGQGGADTADGAGAGGDGGKGGDGGDGGDGGGGPGGPSWAIYISGSSAKPTCTDNTLETVGFPGTGGYGGGTDGSTNKGQDGQSGLIYGVTANCTTD